nr:uncharacterized protein LOC117691965 [Crassostrea gigas]
MLTEQELSKLDMADGELKTPLSTTPTEDFNPLSEDPDNFISGHSPQRQGHHDADCSGSEEESDYQCNSMEEMSTGNLYGVTPPTYMRGVKRDKKKHQTNIQKSSYKQFTELEKASKKSHRNAVIKERTAPAGSVKSSKWTQQLKQPLHCLTYRYHLYHLLLCKIFRTSESKE